MPYSVQKKSFYSLSCLEKGKFNCNISLKITYHFNFLYYAADKPVSPCKEGEFQCNGSNQCIPESKVCDAHKDCTNGEDEPASCGECCLDEGRKAGGGGGLSHGSRTEKTANHGSRQSKFHFPESRK